ncbi:putative oxidoreductase [Lactobacillus rhamnosus GG] [Lacticaseibacillus rhamnosus]|nr:putative oxidoreductase [Lactobacillus rhamnosus GG] [Lacticaseibacillus rhamnosus]
MCICFFFQAEDGIRDSSTARGLGDVYKRQQLATDPLSPAPTHHFPVDPYPIGGRVWKIDQDPNLIMNTAAAQITLFLSLIHI